MAFREAIVITGIGLVTPLGDEKDRFWSLLESGGSGIGDITIFDVSKYDCGRAGEISCFDPTRYLGQKGLKYLSRTSKLLMSAAFMCLKDAGIKNDGRDYVCYSPETVGAIVGTTYGSLSSLCSFDEVALREGPQFVSPMAFPNTVINCHTGYLAIKENIQGLTLTVSTGYAASFDAIGIAVQFLRSGNMKCFIAGGVEELSEEFFLSYLKQGMIAENSYVGEGCGLYTFEKLSDAQSRKAHVYGEIVGYGSTFCPGRGALEKAIEFALQDAKIDSAEIGWIVKGTNLGQAERRIEMEVLNDTFGPMTPTSDLRPLLGDSYSAGGSLQIAAALGVLDRKLAENILVVSLDPCGNSSVVIIGNTRS
jgi:3-oxoacyl-[acyl-carrier-protein] synthase II